jgi:hypothetical protein
MFKSYFTSEKKPNKAGLNLTQNFIDKCYDRYINNKAKALYLSLKDTQDFHITKNSHIEYTENEMAKIEEEWLNAVGVNTDNPFVDDEIECLLCLFYLFNHATEENGKYTITITKYDAVKKPYLKLALYDMNTLMNYKLETFENNQFLTIPPILEMHGDHTKVIFELNPTACSIMENI